jgi:hypothetical protein
MSMLETTQNLLGDIAELQAILAVRDEEITASKAEIRVRDLVIEKLKHQLAGMRRHRFGSSSEALDQLELTLEEEEIATSARDDVNAIEADQPEAPKDKPKRKPLPDHLPRNEEVLSPGEACGHCGGKLKTLGEDVTEELEYVPGRFVVNRIVRPRMACSCCEKIVQAPLLQLLREDRPGPAALAPD